MSAHNKTRKVAVSISIGVTEIFHFLNSSDSTMALGSTQTQTKMSRTDASWG